MHQFHYKTVYISKNLAGMSQYAADAMNRYTKDTAAYPWLVKHVNDEEEIFLVQSDATSDENGSWERASDFFYAVDGYDIDVIVTIDK